MGEGTAKLVRTPSDGSCATGARSFAFLLRTGALGLAAMSNWILCFLIVCVSLLSDDDRIVRFARLVGGVMIVF